MRRDETRRYVLGPATLILAASALSLWACKQAPLSEDTASPPEISAIEPKPAQDRAPPTGASTDASSTKRPAAPADQEPGVTSPFLVTNPSPSPLPSPFSSPSPPPFPSPALSPGPPPS